MLISPSPLYLWIEKLSSLYSKFFTLNHLEKAIIVSKFIIENCFSKETQKIIERQEAKLWNIEDLEDLEYSDIIENAKEVEKSLKEILEWWERIEYLEKLLNEDK